MALTFKEENVVEGLQELDALLAELPDKIARNAMRRALAKGETVFRNEMIASAPIRDMEPAVRKYGPTRKHIRMSTRINRSQGTVTGKVGPDKAVSWYIRWFEYGNSHQPARPWLRPLFRSKAQTALDAIITYMRSEIAKVHAKYK